METQTTTLSELLALTLFLGSIVYLTGAIYQLITLVWLNKKVVWYKILGIIILTRLLTLCSTVLLWKLAFQNVEIMFGPILLPGIFSEMLISPLILKLMDLEFLKKAD